MNLSEKLNLDYCDTAVLLKIYQRHLDSIAKYPEQFPGMTLTIWQTADSPYYKTLLAVKEKQDAGKVVTDEEYRLIPECGNPGRYSVAEYYFLVNFHYNFFDMNNYPDKEELLDKFLNFIAEVEFLDCTSSEVTNWRNTYHCGLRSSYGFDFNAHYDPELDKVVDNIPDVPAWEAAHFTEKEKFILQLLEAVDAENNHTLEILDNVDRRIHPKAFDNVWITLKSRQSAILHYKRKFENVSSLKASEVMEILGISRRTLTRYVKHDIIKIDSCINGRYKYNKESVFNKLEGKNRK